MFRAYDAERERLVAVKLFKLDLPPERVHQLVAALEHLIAAELNHPTMAVPLGTGIADVSAYLAQDYVAAESLDLAVREYGPAPVADALRVAAQLAGALDFAAVVNVAHGALHPRDILLSSDETRVTGVGVAQALESVGVVAPVRRPYTAPERIAGGPWDRRADVFSLAALIHELLWAHRITGTGDHIAESLTELPGADLRALRRVFARALADDPNTRFETALEFVDALKSAFPDVTLSEPEVRRKPDQPAAPDRRSRSTVPDRSVPAQLPDTASMASADGGLPLTKSDASRGRGDRELRLPLEVSEPVVATSAEAPLSADFDPDALDQYGPEAARYDQVEAAPALVIPEETTPMREQPLEAPPPISLIEESRSAVWPLVASLLIGLALGFAGGYGVGTRERPATVVAARPSGTPTPAPSGKEATDVAIAEAPTLPPATPPPAPPDAQPQKPLPEPAPDARSAQPPRAKSEQPSASRRPAKTAESRPQTVRPERESQPASAPTSGRFQGKLNVDSRPTGARVFLDGRLVGTTPLVIASVPAGEHAVRIERDGYRRWSSSVRVVAAEQNRVTASLER